MDLTARVRALTAADLTVVLRRVLRDDASELLGWTAESPDWTALVAKGIYLLRGSARLGSGEETSWAVVLKVVEDDGSPEVHEPDGLLYWRREALALTSGLLDQQSGPFVPVRLLHVQETAENELWMWLECLDDSQPKVRWTAAQHVAAAYDLGAFNAQWCARPPSVQDFGWLSQRWLRGWLDYSIVYGAQHAAEHRDWWKHPLIAAVLPPATYERFAALMDDAEELLSVLEDLPVTLVHHDAQWRNLFQLKGTDPARPHARTVAVDWAFLGLAPLGADLGHMVGCNIEHWAVDDARQHDVAATTAYLQGLQDFGWRGDERAVRFARAITAAVQMVPLFGAEVSWLHGEPVETWAAELAEWPQELATKQELSVEATMAGWATQFGYLLDLGDEARRLATALG
jgi:hypothetical protein